MMNKAIKLLAIATASAFSLAAVAATETHLVQIKATNDDCVISKKCLFKVNAPTAAQPYYLVNEVCDDMDALFMNKLLMRDQLSNNEYLGTKYCHGVVSYSDMNLPFSTHVPWTGNHGIQDANDGRLLIDVMESTIKDDLDLLNGMSKAAKEAASGSMTPDQLSNLQTEYVARLNELERVAYSATFNDLAPFNSGSSIDVPVFKGSKKIHIDFYEFSVNGLHLTGTTIGTVDDAKTAIFYLTQAIERVNTSLGNIKHARIELQAAADHDATITSIDLRGKEIIVQKQSV